MCGEIQTGLSAYSKNYRSVIGYKEEKYTRTTVPGVWEMEEHECKVLVRNVKWCGFI